MDTTNILTEATATGTVAAPQTTPEPAAPTLAEVIGSTNEENKAGQNDTHVDAIPQQEPGWYAKRRAQDRAQWDAEHQADMARMQEQVNTLREYWLSQEADKLVVSGKITDRDIAVEYLRSKEGVPAPTTQPATTPQRDAQGRFVATPKAPEVPVEIQQRASTLTAQADAILGTTGVDVMQIFNTDPAVKQKVVSGEWDFTDVFKNAGGSQQAAVKPHVPVPVRSSNGVGLGNVSIGKMSDQQFAALNDFLAKNGKVNMS